MQNKIEQKRIDIVKNNELMKFLLKKTMIKMFVRNPDNKEDFSIYEFKGIFNNITIRQGTILCKKKDNPILEEIAIEKMEIIKEVDLLIENDEGETYTKFTANLYRNPLDISGMVYFYIDNIRQVGLTWEKRKYQRIKLFTPIKFIPYSYIASKMPFKYWDGDIIDISEGGLQLASKQKLTSGIVIYMNFDLPNIKNVKAKGIIRWFKESNLNIYYGIQFTEISPKDLLKINLLVRLSGEYV